MVQSLFFALKQENKLLGANKDHFQHHVDGIVPTTPPSSSESFLYCMTLKQWNSLNTVELDTILGTGRNLFIEGLWESTRDQEPASMLMKRHALDAEMDVQGLSTPIKKTYALIILCSL